MPDFHQKSFRIKHAEERWLSKLLAKETSKSNPSFRVYYGDVSGAVPFTWETSPGTPKHVSSENPHIPPLTPPPSYYTNNFNNSSKKISRSKLLLHNLLRRVNPKKFELAPSSLSSSSSSQSLSSDPLSTPGYVRKRPRFSSRGSSSSIEERTAMDDHRRDEVRSWRLCFGIGNGRGFAVVTRR